MQTGKSFASLTPEQRALFSLRLKHERRKAAGNQRIRRHPGADIYPLSLEQEHLWVLHLLDPDSPVYNLNHTFVLEGSLNVPALERCFDEIVRRHETLRTSFVLRDGLPWQFIEKDVSPVIARLDLSQLPEPEREDRAVELATEQAWRPFSLTRDRPMRATLLRLSERRHFLLLTLHHIITDWWSFKALYRELSVLYRTFVAGEPSPLADLPIQYGDYALWQREWLQGETLERLSGYWMKQLAGAPPLLDIPLDHPRPTRQTFRGARRQFTIPMHLAEGIKALSRREKTTQFITLLGVFQTLLHRYSSQMDVLVGTPSANRSHGETEGLIGYLLNMLILRGDFSGSPSFHQLVERLRSVVAGAQANQALPAHKVVEGLKPDRSSSHMPVYQTGFIFLTSQVPTMESLDSRGSMLNLPGLVVGGLEVENVTSWLDLTLVLEEHPDGFAGFFEYNTDLFDATAITRMQEHLEHLMAAIIAEPDRPVADLEFLTLRERRLFAPEADLFATEVDDEQVSHASEGSIHGSFEAQVEKAPDAVAVVCEDEQLSYRELNQRANQLARHLRKNGVGDGTPVAVCVKRSVAMVVTLLGILKAGGYYVPLDPMGPPERLALMLKDCGAQTLVTQTDVLQNLIARPLQVVCLDGDAEAISNEERQDLSSGTTSNDLAYTIFTSGSTGQPKGVVVSHGGVLNLFAGSPAALKLSAGDVLTNFHSYTFDFSVWEIFGALLYGARLVIVPHEVAKSPRDFLDLLRRERVTVLNQTPSAMRSLLREREETDRGEEKLYLRLVACGAESLPHSMAAALKRWGVAVWNLYGPTEATVWATADCFDDAGTEEGTVPIGRPWGGVEVYVLDQRLNPVATNVVGELYIGGTGVAQGYHNRPAATAASFIPHPFSRRPGARLYRTGDLARRTSEGDLEFLGRRDHQVKVRGFRVELGEIEAAINSHECVAGAVVHLHERAPGEGSLVANFVTTKDAELDGSELRRFLKDKLPEYMIPSAFNLLDELPRTISGKIDRKRLLVSVTHESRLRESYAAPRTEVERTLVNIWAEVLGREQVGIYDDFFELGGHSLSLTQMASRIRANFNVEVPLRVLYNAPTVADMTVAIAEQQLSLDDDHDATQLIEELSHLSAEEATLLLAS